LKSEKPSCGLDIQGKLREVFWTSMETLEMEKRKSLQEEYSQHTTRTSSISKRRLLRRKMKSL
jgi:hypothetical protein